MKETPRSSTAVALDEAGILLHFDQLVRDGVIFYDPNPQIISHQDGGLKFEFRITNALKNKPSVPSAPLAENSQGKEAAILKPGSDISVAGFEVENIGTTHLLTFNMFDAFRPHFLLLTQDGHRRQYEPLDVDDFRAAHTVISSLGSKYMAIYNCGVESGCSRFHKHLQIIPQAGETFNVWRNIIAQTQTLPYQAFVHAYDRGMPSPEELQTIYLDLFQQAQTALGQSVSEDNRAPPHNVIFDQTGMMVIPRRAAGLHGAEANAAGMLGVIWMSDMAKAEQWLELGPAEVLKTAGVPKSSTF